MRPVRFLLDGEVIEIDDLDPTRTLLQFLREDLRRVGTKEGCAEGDCGACTVVLAELTEQRLQYRALNACILFVPMLDGKALFTVESLKAIAGKLHPVQQALVDYHASQCGFCTPGFVMSMFALYQSTDRPKRAQIDDALSGNLCRCTGYRPIIDACRHLHDYPPVAVDEARLITQLEALQQDDDVGLTHLGLRYDAPRSLARLAELYTAHPDAQILAGGTDVGLWVTKQLRELQHVIYLGQVAELQRIDIDDNWIRVGAAVSLSDAFAAIEPDYPELGEMFRRFASVPVRNAGTLVGNLANGSPIGDSMPAFMVIESRVLLRRGDSTRELALEDLYLDYMQNAMRPGEFIEAVLLPRRDPALSLRCYKLSKRFDQDISAVCAAFALRLDGTRVAACRIAMGGMAAIPQRAAQTQAALDGRSWDPAAVRGAMAKLADDFTPLGDMRASADYRARAAANLLYRFYLETRPQQPLPSDAVNVFAVSA